MKKFIFHAFSVFIFLTGTACVPAAISDTELETLIIQKSDSEKITYHIEVADTDATRRRGLMYREHMPSDQGMLLDFMGNYNVGIWMKNTYIPLDLIFIDAAGKIVYIYPDATPLSTRTISTDRRVKAVLEVNSGQVKVHGVRVGDRVVFPSFNSSE